MIIISLWHLNTIFKRSGYIQMSCAYMCYKPVTVFYMWIRIQPTKLLVSKDGYWLALDAHMPTRDWPVAVLNINRKIQTNNIKGIITNPFWIPFGWTNQSSWLDQCIKVVGNLAMDSLLVQSVILQKKLKWISNKTCNLLLKSTLDLMSLLTFRQRAILSVCNTVSSIDQWFFSCSFNLATNRWWSVATVAPLFVLTSSTDVVSFFYWWSTWFSVVWCGEYM